ncbi:heavy-metal-associated domain-containing protein [Rubritalea sp.]|uniref:heavy-metal-associated domain-containing protein n=1 Tax=Rubritalea sp. TaxID=2109375 RepID=UPI003EF24B11
MFFKKGLISESHATSTVARYTVAGMTCQGCTVKLRNALNSLDGVEIDNISYRTGDIDLKLSEGVTSSLVEETITKSGYSIVPAQ